MTKYYDIVVRGGTVVDGSGGPAFKADIAICADRIAAIGQGLAEGRDEIDARGRIVTPGFVDIHTHYDGQVTWESCMAPSSNHGVTTVVMGNCGVGFAPCRANEHDMLVRLMEGVEDIPEIVMTEGIPWNWETFPEYLDALAKREADVDFAAQIPHSALRVFVMGRRAEDREPPAQSDLALMRALTAEAVRSGAIGVSSSLSKNHRTVRGEPAPSVLSEKDELLALAGGLRDAQAGVFQIIHDNDHPPAARFALMRELAAISGRPVSFTLAQQVNAGDAWREMLAELDRATADGLTIRGQVFPRPIGFLMGLDLSFHPFSLHPSYRPLAALPLTQRIEALRQTELRDRILAEKPVHTNPFVLRQVQRLDQLYLLGDPPNYEPDPDTRLASIAQRRGLPLTHLIYDLLLENGGKNIFYVPAANYCDGNLDATRVMMAHAQTVIGLGDGGAHYGIICDSSYPTFVLTRWVRDALPDKGFGLSWAVSALSREPAEAVGLFDRGILMCGYKADINIIDYERLHLHAPEVAYDLPAGGRRLSQRSEGYATTIVSGRVTRRDGAPTGLYPGRLVRGAQKAVQT